MTSPKLASGQARSKSRPIRRRSRWDADPNRIGRARMDEAYIGVDVGTGSARAGVFDVAGRLLASAKRPIEIWYEPGEIVEQSSEDIWRAATGAVREAVA